MMFAEVRRTLLTADPGLQRTLLAGRATLSVALTVAVVFPLARAMGQPSVTLMLAASTSMIGSFAIAGPDARSLAKAAAVAWGGVTAAILLGGALSPYPIASYAAFVGIMSVGAWAGRFGPRGFALSTIAFMAYFFTLFTGSTIGDAPWLLALGSIGLGVAVLTRTVILRDPPRSRVRRLLVALRAHTETLIAHAGAEPSGSTKEHARRLRLDAAELDGVILQLHDVLRDAPGAIPDPHRFRRHLAAVVTLTHLLVLQEQHGQDAADPALTHPAVEPTERLRLRLAALEAVAAGRDDAAVFGDVVPFDAGGDRGVPPADPVEIAREQAPRPEEPATGGWLTGSRRTMVQVAIAGALSIAIGYQLSPERWYWAAMSAYFVFVNTGSRGATMRKALERMVGTAAGVAGGMLVGFLLAGHTRLELVFIFPLLFLGYWMLSVSYAVMIGMITILIALLYDVMGMLTTDVLILRLEETVLGAAIGTVVAFFVVPTRTRGAVEIAFGGYFDAMDELLAALDAGADGAADSEPRILAAVHDLDRAVGTLRAAIRPVIAAVPGRRAQALKQEMILAMTARYWVSRLAGSMLFHTAAVGPDELRRQAALVRERIASLRIGGGSPDDVTPAEELAMDASPLLRVDSILAELGRARVRAGVVPAHAARSGAARAEPQPTR